MSKNKEKKLDNLYQFSSPKISMKDIEKNKKKEMKLRKKKIKERNKFLQNQIGFDEEKTVGMAKSRKKNKKRISKKQKLILNVVKTTVFLAIVVGAIILTCISPLFNITEIYVLDNSKISTETIMSLSGISMGQNLFKFNKKDVKQSIKSNPYIEKVEIKRTIPNKVTISIKEREKDFNIEFLNEYAYINKQGYILEISEQKAELPVIQGISTEQEQIQEGNRLNNEDLQKLQEIIQIVNICKNYGIDTKISTINVEDINNCILIMESEKKTIYLGDKTNLSQKMLYVTSILEENIGIEGTIYVNGDINGNFKPRFREKV